MKLGTKGRYAVAAMTDLALTGVKDEPVSLSGIAQNQALPLQYLEQLFNKLKKANLVMSVRGQTGGYLLARAPESITIKDIILAVDESLKSTGCQEGLDVSCRGLKGRCHTHNLWEGLNRHVVSYLEGITLDDLIHRRVTPMGIKDFGYARVS